MGLDQKRARGRPRSALGGQAAYPVQALDRAFRLLSLVAREDGLTLTELAQRAGVAPSTAHRLLTTMEAHGVVDFGRESQVWTVGVEAFRMGSAFLRRTKILDVGRSVMRELMEACGETINLGIANEGDVVFLSQVETHEPIRAFFRPGTRGPMHASGIGKALLADLPRDKVRDTLNLKGLDGFTDKTIVDPARLFDELAAIRQRGWAVDDEERHAGMRCVAALIYNEYGEALAGISISGPTVRVTRERLGELGPRIKRAGAEITNLIGGRVPDYGTGAVP